MKIETILAVPLLASCLALSACSKKASEPVHTPKQAKPAAVEAEAAPERTSFEEPPEEVLKKFMFKAYEAMNDAGGLPVTVTATGRSGKLRARLYSVKKADCKLIDIPSIAPPGKFECSVDLKVDMWWDGQREPGTPSDDSKRIDVIQDDRGNWLDCSHEAEKNKDFCDVRAANMRQGGK